MKDKVVITDIVVAIANGLSKAAAKNILKNLHTAEAFSVIAPKSLLKNVKCKFDSKSVAEHGALYVDSKAMLISTPK